jgi:hypothetical protein
MILSGDIITFKNFEPLSDFLSGWTKPVLYVAGNHEYYTQLPMNEGESAFQNFTITSPQNIAWLNNSDFSLGNTQFFGGTMWTDFNNSNPISIHHAFTGMNDFRQIVMHEVFKEKLIPWLEKNNGKTRVVISHHAPVKNPHTKHSNSRLQDAFNSLDMVDIIKKYQPDLWTYL